MPGHADDEHLKFVYVCLKNKNGPTIDFNGVGLEYPGVKLNTLRMRFHRIQEKLEGKPCGDKANGKATKGNGSNTKKGQKRKSNGAERDGDAMLANGAAVKKEKLDDGEEVADEL